MKKNKVYGDATWGSSYILSHYRGLPYSRVETTDEVTEVFYNLCNQNGFRCEWFPFASVIIPNETFCTEKQLSHLREEAISIVRDRLVSALEARAF